MSKEPLRFYAYLNPAFGQYEIFLAENLPDGYYIAKPAEFVKATSGEYSPPLLRLEESEAQRLMDALWVAGVRPNNGEGSIGQIGAIQKHLDDMRAIVAKELGVTL